MPCRIAICDDDPAAVTIMTELTKTWAGARELSLHLETFPSAEAFLFHYAEDKDFDILLLDIEMGKMDGVTMARQIRRENETVQIIFVTGYSDYIAEGYEVAALHYLMKPVDRDKLFSVLDRALVKKGESERYLNLELSGEMVRIPFRELRYLEVRQNYVTLFAGEEYTVKRTLGEFERELDQRFCRVGRSLLVNLDKVRRVTKTQAALTDGTLLPLPRGGFETLNRAIIDRE